MKLQDLISPSTWICFIGFMDLFGVSLFIPLFHNHVMDLGASPTLAGLIGSIYGFLQMISSPLMGRLSDTIGRRVSLIFVLVVCGAMYVCMGLVSSIFLLSIIRVVLGTFKHSQMISRALLSDSLPKHERSSAFGRFNAISVVGFIVGPTIGGHLQHNHGFLAPAALCGCVFLLNSVLVSILIPENNSQTKATNKGDENKMDETVSLIVRINLFKRELQNLQLSNVFKNTNLFSDIQWLSLSELIIANFSFGMAFIMYRTNFYSLMNERYNTNSISAGYLTSVGSSVSVIVGFFTGYATKYYDDDYRLWQHCALVQVVAISVMAVNPSFYIFVAMQVLLSAVGAIGRVVSLNSLVERGGGGDKAGTIMGISQSTLATSRTIAPFLAGVAQEFSTSGPIAVSSVLTFVGFLILSTSSYIQRFVCRVCGKKKSE